MCFEDLDLDYLTDAKHFQGALGHLRAIREALPAGPPVLRKDFLFEEYQLYEARASNDGASPSIESLLPAMFEAAMKDFPHTGINPRKVTTEITKKP